MRLSIIAFDWQSKIPISLQTLQLGLYAGNDVFDVHGNPYKISTQQIFTFLKEKLRIVTTCASILLLSHTLVVLPMASSRALHTCQF